MGTKIAKYSFVPKENEQIDTVITITEEPRSVIHGVVKDEKGRYVKDAVVKLFRAKECDDHCALKPITHTFTDECGQFIFGPLVPGKKYVIKVWVNDVKIYKTEDEDSKDDWDEPEDDASAKCATPQKPKSPVKDNNYPDKYYFK